MNEQERYAQVKRLFLGAVKLPFADRAAYLDEQCIGQTELRPGVETLLEHHNSETILGEEREQASSAASPSRLVDRRLATGSINASLSPQLVAELLQILRRRLKGLAAVLTAALFISLARSVINPAWNFVWAELIVLTAVMASWLVLHRSKNLSVLSMRVIETVMMSSVCVLVASTDVIEIMEGSREKDLAAIVGATARSHLAWCMIIMIYGIFVPNTWQRAAMYVLPVACVPYLIRFAVSSADAYVYDVLEFMRYVRPVPMPFLAAFSAIYAAHLFSIGRVRVSHARQFAQYRIGRLLGSGGMGEVYEAEHSMLKRPCAVKVIRPDRQYNPSTLARFEEEVQSTARLTHPNTIEIYDYGQTIDGIFYYVMEFLPGGSLNELVNRFGPLPASRACYLVRQACSAMQEAHDVGLIHRDIKPGNLFVSEQGGERDVIKVLDFGLVSNAMDNNVASSRRDSARLMGTPPFMPPEQGLGFGEVDARSDIYAMGATIYYLVTGSLLFDEPTPQTQLIAHVTLQVERPSQRVDNLPSDLEDVILRCLEKDPPDRFQSMRELQQALGACACSQDWTKDDAERWWQSHSE